LLFFFLYRLFLTVPLKIDYLRTYETDLHQIFSTGRNFIHADLAFRNGLEDRNGDVKRLNDDDISTSVINLMSFRPVHGTLRDWNVLCVHQASISARVILNYVRWGTTFRMPSGLHASL